MSPGVSKQPEDRIKVNSQKISPQSSQLAKEIKTFKEIEEIKETKDIRKIKEIKVQLEMPFYHICILTFIKLSCHFYLIDLNTILSDQRILWYFDKHIFSSMIINERSKIKKKYLSLSILLCFFFYQ